MDHPIFSEWIQKGLGGVSMVGVAKDSIYQKYPGCITLSFPLFLSLSLRLKMKPLWIMKDLYRTVSWLMGITGYRIYKYTCTKILPYF